MSSSAGVGYTRNGRAVAAAAATLPCKASGGGDKE